MLKWSRPECSTGCSRRDSIWPSRLGHMGVITSAWTFGILIWVNQLYVMRILKQSHGQFNMERNQLVSASLIAMWLSILINRFSRLNHPEDDSSCRWHLTAASWKTPSHNCPAELLLNYCPAETWLWFFLNHCVLYVC